MLSGNRTLTTAECLDLVGGLNLYGCYSDSPIRDGRL